MLVTIAMALRFLEILIPPRITPQGVALEFIVAEELNGKAEKSHPLYFGMDYSRTLSAQMHVRSFLGGHIYNFVFLFLRGRAGLGDGTSQAGG